MEELYKLPLSSLCETLLLGYNVESISLDYKYRHEVATRIWIMVKITFHDQKCYDISGSANSIVKRRIIELLEKMMNS